jgi:hypothetical protein
MRIYAKHKLILDYVAKVRKGGDVKLPISLPFSYAHPLTPQQVSEWTTITRGIIGNTDKPEALSDTIYSRIVQDNNIIPESVFSKGYRWMEQTSGVLLLNSGLSLFYSLTDSRDDERVFTVYVFEGADKGGLIATEMGYFREDTGELQVIPAASINFFSEGVSYVQGGFFVMLLRYLFFKKHVDVDEVELVRNSALKKAKIGHEKFLNESDVAVRVIDSSWFRSVAVVGDTVVEGHLRLQPYGAKREQRKLIWISEHERKGYTRQAGKKKLYANT